MKIINNINDFEEILSDDGGKYAVFNLQEAYNFCENIAKNHYENFPVGSLLIPKAKRHHFYSIYTFARLADDISDEFTDKSAEFRISLLNRLFNLIKKDVNINSQKKNPLALALQNTIKEKNIPYLPFEKLIKAFELDSNFVQADRLDDHLKYCSYSANPIGELILRLFDNYNDETAKYSDAICSALQLVNFWQDISVDLTKNRIFIPKENLKLYKISDFPNIDKQQEDDFRACLEEIYDFTKNFFIFGKDLVNLIENNRLRLEIIITIEGGSRILTKTKQLDTDIIYNRPNLNKIDYIVIIARSVFNLFFSYGNINIRKISKLRKS